MTEYNVRAVSRALNILECFTAEEPSLQLTEIAQQVELSASTTLRILATLEDHNFVYKNPETNKYYLGLKVAQLGNLAFKDFDIAVEAQPLLKKICDEFNESVGIYQRIGDKRLCIARMNSTQTLRSVLEVGCSYPLTRGAAGRVLLSYMADKDITRLLKKDDFTTKENLKQVKKDGYTVSKGERDSAVESIAAPIFNAKGQVDYALFITGPAGRFDDTAKEKMIEAIKENATLLSEKLGYVAE